METKPIVLFLCTGNSARSQMAEGLLRAKAGALFEARSAGTTPAEAVHPLAVQAMEEIGIDISAQRPKDVAAFLGRLPVRHLIIVCASANQRCPSVFPGVLSRDFWPIEDPADPADGSSPVMEGFCKARDEIAERLEAWLKDKSARRAR
jgi:arsenate reductase